MAKYDMEHMTQILANFTDKEMAHILRCVEGIHEDTPYDEGTITELARHMLMVETTMDKVKEISGVLNTAYDLLRFGKLVEKMNDAEMTNTNLEGIGRVTLASDISISTKEGGPEKLHEWLLELGLGGLIKEKVESSTLKSQIRAMIKEGKVIPEDVVTVKAFQRVSITKK